jgi:maltose O-acetyltransferase
MSAVHSHAEARAADPSAHASSARAPTLVSRLRSGLRAVARAGRSELTLDPIRMACSAISRRTPQFSFVRTRTALLRAAGLRIGARSLIMGPVEISGTGSVRDLFSIGDDTYVTGPLHVDLGASVHIGNRVRLGHHVVLLTVDHEIGPSQHRCGNVLVAPIHVGDGAWLASRVTVLPGVSIGNGAIVAAGAVVTQDVEPNTLVGGVPARVVRELPEDPPPVTRRRFKGAASDPPRDPGTR